MVMRKLGQWVTAEGQILLSWVESD